MPIEDILRSIDQEISQLQRARTLLAGDPVVEVPRKRGRPKGATKRPQAAKAAVQDGAAKRTMSAEGKARIAAAQKARWAKQKKASATPKKTASTSSFAVVKKINKPNGKKTLTTKTSVAKKKTASSASTSAAQSVSLAAVASTA